MSLTETKINKSEARIETHDQEEKFDQEKFSSFQPIERDISEDQEALFHDIFTKNTFINEKWDKHIFIDGQINSIGENLITVNCLVDEENLHFKEKVFPKNLLSHIQDLRPNTFLRVKISYKSGSMRYDIYDGKGLNIDTEAFSANKLWDSLKDFKFDDPQ